MAITESLRGVGQLLAQTVYVTVSTFVTQRGAFIVLSIITGYCFCGIAISEECVNKKCHSNNGYDEFHVRLCTAYQATILGAV